MTRISVISVALLVLSTTFADAQPAKLPSLQPPEGTAPAARSAPDEESGPASVPVPRERFGLPAGPGQGATPDQTAPANSRVRANFPRGWSNELYRRYEQAAERHQPLLVLFIQDNCPWCDRFVAEIDDSPVMRGLQSHALLVAVDPARDEDDKGNVAGLAKALGINRYPTLVVLEAAMTSMKEKGRLIGHFPIGEMLDNLATMMPELAEALARPPGTWIGSHGQFRNQIRRGLGFLALEFKCGGTTSPALSVELPYDRSVDMGRPVHFVLTIRKKADMATSLTPGLPGTILDQQAGSAHIPPRLDLKSPKPLLQIAGGTRAVTLVKEIAMAGEVTLRIEGTKSIAPHLDPASVLTVDIPVAGARQVIDRNLKFCKL